MKIERHPLEPFLPANARLLMLGSFPPQKKRWSMEFYYPNWNNDMWRIVGLLFFNDKNHFLNEAAKAFDKDRIIPFLQKKGIALFDTATAIRRWQTYATLSDAFFFARLSACFRKKSSNLPHYVSGLTDVIRRESVKIIAHPSCIFESLHYLCSRKHGSSSVGRALVSKTRCREFEPLLPCKMKIAASKNLQLFLFINPL